MMSKAPRLSEIIGRPADVREAEPAAFVETLESLAAGVFLLADNGCIVYANAAAQALIDERRVLHSAHGALVTADADANHALRDAFASVQNSDAAVGVSGIAVPLRSTDGERWVAHVLPLTSGVHRQAGRVHGATTAVFVRRAALDMAAPIALIVKQYALTPGEMRVLQAVVEIGGVAAVARSLGISEQTVKTHLRHLYEKTETRRQADLVKLVASHASPFGPGER